MNMDIDKRRKHVEAAATFGLLLLAAGLVAPFASIENQLLCGIFKYVFAVGAVIYTAARLVNVNAPGDSIRLKRMRRMEMWAGFCFLTAAFFWFYKSYRYPELGFTLGVVRDTILFTLSGALIQIVASWLISARMKKEYGQPKDKK